MVIFITLIILDSTKQHTDYFYHENSPSLTIEVILGIHLEIHLINHVWWLNDLLLVVPWWRLESPLYGIYG